MLGLGSTIASSFLGVVPFLVIPEGPGLGLLGFGGPVGDLLGFGGPAVLGDLLGFGFVGGLGLVLLVLVASLF